MTKMLLQVHDELVFEVPEEETEAVGAMVKEEMERVHPLDVPLKVDINIGRDWEEAPGRGEPAAYWPSSSSSNAPTDENTKMSSSSNVRAV